MGKGEKGKEESEGQQTLPPPMPRMRHTPLRHHALIRGANTHDITHSGKTVFRIRRPPAGDTVG